jgi:hypothetical protein
MAVGIRTAAWVVAALAVVVQAAGGCGGVSGNSGLLGPGADGGGDSTAGDDSGSSSGSSGSSGGSGSSSGSGSGGGSGSSSGDSGHACVNLECQVHACNGSVGDAGTTTLSGTVYDPGGHNPIYGVAVYIPNSPGGALDAITPGVGSTSCDCGALYSGDPIVTTVTDVAGNFTLNNVPDGANIPLVVQIGKWRKEVPIASITPCTPNSAGKINLPKNPTDGAFASMPNIAVSTGGADTLECMLTRMGVDEGAFTGSPTGAGVHVFQGAAGYAATGSPSSPTSLWDGQADLMRYDLVMLSCEGAPTTGVTATTATYLAPYISAGGRVFAEHYHYAFFTDDTTLTGPAYPQFANVASWTNLGTLGNDAPYAADITGVIQTTLPGGAAFPAGMVLKQWLGDRGALNASSEIVVPVASARDDGTVTAANVGTPWVQTDPSVTPASTQIFSWDMPFNPPDAGTPSYCGRVVYSDMHVSGSQVDYTTSKVVPTGCDATAALSPDEDAIEFLLFNLSSCIVPVSMTPQ